MSIPTITCAGYPASDILANTPSPQPQPAVALGQVGGSSRVPGAMGCYAPSWPRRGYIAEFAKGLRARRCRA